jgi:lipopolysaccharide export system protein LptA
MIMVFVSLAAEELKVTADLFESDEKKGVTLFKGNVVIHKGQDRLSAQSVEIFTDAKRKPTKFIAIGDVDFVINAKNSNTYKGTSDKAVFLPQAKEYYFYNNVYLTQEGTDNTIKGNTIIVNLTKGTAMAQGDSSKPVTMTFQINDEDNND